jgi:CubicO group peptidase (beta-lactamase class C family)
MTGALPDRRKFLTGAAALGVASASARAATSNEWQTITLAEAGFAPDLEARLDQFVAARLTNTHGIILARRGRVVFERYYEGDDVVRTAEGRAESARVIFTAERSHDLRSVTKSIIGLLYGIALDEGKVPLLDAPLLAQFPQYTDLPDMALRHRWTIAHAITMTLGTQWDEDISYDDPRNGEIAMYAAPDRVRYVLEQPIVAVAGERWIYNGGATALIGKIVEQGVGTSIHDYARRVLFDPLGIGPTEWRLLRDGETIFASGLRMTPRDLARIGQMVLDGGRAAERQIVPAAWLEDSFKPAARITDRRWYGYQWYHGYAPYESPEGPRRARYAAAIGNGGQRLVVFPDLDLVVIITAGNYNLRGRAPDDIFIEVLLPATTP